MSVHALKRTGLGNQLNNGEKVLTGKKLVASPWWVLDFRPEGKWARGRKRA